MQALLFNYAQAFMGFMGQGMIGKITGDDVPQAIKDILNPILELLGVMLVPIIITVATIGSIYAIILGVNFARAEEAGKRDEAKKRMINAIIAIVATILLLIILQLFAANADAIATWITTSFA